MKHFILLTCLCLPMVAQEKAATYIGAGAAFNQIGTPRWNLFASAVYPVVSKVGLYTSTTTDVIPVQRLDIATNRQYWAFTTSIRQGVHKVLLSQGKFTFLMGGDAGVGVNQADTGIAMSLNGSFTATGIYQISDKWALAVPINGLWVNGAWNLVPKLGLLFRP